MHSKLIGLVVALVGVALSVQLVQMPEYFSIAQKPSRYLQQPEAPLTFSWDSCGAASDPIAIKALSVLPDPLVLGENITVSFAFTNAITVNGGRLELTLEKKIFGIWTELPCIDNIGSCTYGNFCTLLKPEPCKPPFSTYNIPCKCPFPAGAYKLPASSIHTHNPGVSWLTSGDYYAKVQLFDDNNKELGCYEAYATLANS